MKPERTDRTEKTDSPRWVQLRELAKSDPELAKQLEAAERVMRENAEVLRRLADS